MMAVAKIVLPKHLPMGQMMSLLSESEFCLSILLYRLVDFSRSDGTLYSTSWIAQIGKLNSLFQSREGREVAIFVNSVPARARSDF